MSIPIIDTLNPIGSFPAVKSKDVDCDGTRLNTVLEGKANKAYVDEKIAEIPAVDVSGKADKTYVDTELGKKANTSALSAKADKSYVDAELAKKASTTDISGKADKSYVDTQLDKKADSVALNGKVDKVDGKGLSENDYSDAERAMVLKGNEAATNLNLMFKIV